MKAIFRPAIFAVTIFVSLARLAPSQTAAATDPNAFAPLDQWKTAVLSGDPALIANLYSTSPAFKVETEKGASDPTTETNFWVGLKARKMNVEIVKSQSPQAGVQVVIFQAEVQSAASNDQFVYVTEAQAWQHQGESWRMVAAKRTEPSHLKQPPDQSKNIYPDNVDARKEIKEAEQEAAKDHKRVLLVFGANWCYDCHVLDLAFHRPDFASAIGGYEVVHVDIGKDGKKNADLATQFQVPLDKGVPALAVLEADGKLVVSQKNGEFENARAMTPQALLEFLNKWKPEAR